MSVNQDKMVIDLNSVEEPSSFEPPPVGTYLCCLEVSELDWIGNNGSKGFRVKGRVVEAEYRGAIIEDVLFISEKALGRLKMVLHRVAGIENGQQTAAQIRNALGGRLARLTVKEGSRRQSRAIRSTSTPSCRSTATRRHRRKSSPSTAEVRWTVTSTCSISRPPTKTIFRSSGSTLPANMLNLPDILSAIAVLDRDQLPALMLAIAARMASAKSTPVAADDELLSVQEAATMLGVSRSKLYHGDFPFVVKVGGARRYSRNGIQKYIERRQGKA